MSPPIRDGSGSSIGAIRLGDGSEISEVRTGAGDVLFSSVPIPKSGLIHRYSYNGSSNTSTLTDSVGSLNGSISGMTYTTSSKEGSHAGDYDGSNDEVSITGVENLNPGSFGGWFFPTDGTTNQRAIYLFENNDAFLIIFNRPNDGDVSFNAGGINSSDIFTSYNLNAFNHIFVTWDGSTVRLYHNGVRVDSTSKSSDNTNRNASDFLGSGNGSNFFEGRMDDIVFYDRQLSDSEVSDLFNSY